MAEEIVAGELAAGEEIVALRGGGLLIPSFTDPDTSYKVHPDSGYCQCPRHRETGKCVKHVAFARAVQRLRGRNLWWFSKTTTEIAEAKLFELCCRIYAPVNRKESCIESWKLSREVECYRHATEEMKEAARKRHGRVLLLHDEKRAA